MDSARATVDGPDEHRWKQMVANNERVLCCRALVFITVSTHEDEQEVGHGKVSQTCSGLLTARLVSEPSSRHRLCHTEVSCSGSKPDLGSAS